MAVSDVCLVRPQLYLSSARSECRKELLDLNGITHILQAGVELSPSHEGQFTYLQLPLQDMPEQDIVSCFPAAFAFIQQGLDAGGGVLVHCQAGVSRSATLVIAWLMAKERLGADAATAVVTAARSIIWPNGGFAAQLRAWEALGCDASRWQGWKMNDFLSRRYGSESVAFWENMLGSDIRSSRKLMTQQPYYGGTSDAVCLMESPFAGGTSGAAGSASQPADTTSALYGLPRADSIGGGASTNGSERAHPASSQHCGGTHSSGSHAHRGDSAAAMCCGCEEASS